MSCWYGTGSRRWLQSGRGAGAHGVRWCAAWSDAGGVVGQSACRHSRPLVHMHDTRPPLGKRLLRGVARRAAPHLLDGCTASSCS